MEKARWQGGRTLAVTLVIFFSLIFNGCSRLTCCMSFPVQGGQESIHYVVIGFGIVSIPKPEQKIALLATKVQSLGVNISDQPGLKLGVGYASSTIVAVP